MPCLGVIRITHPTSGARRAWRNRILIVLSTLAGLGIAQVLGSAEGLSLGHAIFLLATNTVLVATVLAAAAIDLEHMILPNELTLGATALCLLSSPLRSIGITASLAGAALGFALSYLPFLLYKKLRGKSGMGLGDAKLMTMAGAWHGIEGAIFVLFAGALQSTLAAVAMRLSGLRYDVPASVQAEIADLRARAAAGDVEAKEELADDPMAAGSTTADGQTACSRCDCRSGPSSRSRAWRSCSSVDGSFSTSSVGCSFNPERRRRSENAPGGSAPCT